ncbi:MAG: hypothetical protein EAX89_10840 [Candidatus Lokiarchaeota archaeon]|nr:hypothetical protein [Candidatus Lokiarchaeota archaeon]
MRKINFKTIVLAFMGILFFGAMLGVAMASDDDEDGVEDEFEDEVKRTIDLEIESDKIQIESILRSGTTINKVEFEIRNDTNGVSIKVEFTPNYISDSNESQIQLEFEVTFKEIIEYIDENNDGLFNESADIEIQVYELNDFLSTEHTIFDISTDTKMHYLLISTTDGVFKAHIYLVEEFNLVNNTLITPSESKIDVEINNFGYLNDSSRLALYTKLEAETEYEHKDETESEELGYESHEEGIFTSMNNHFGFFSWKENASIDNISKPVMVGKIEDNEFEPGEQKLFLNYPRGTLIYHDPKLGIEGLLINSSNPSVISGFTVFTLVIASIIGLIATIVLIKRKFKV